MSGLAVACFCIAFAAAIALIIVGLFWPDNHN